jgi:TonB-linked SusC/RagA family outer membrane protein
MRKILQLFLVFSMALLLLPAFVQAQERTVTGTILSEDNKTPLAGVTVRVKGTRRIVTTDANGKFSIRVNPGELLQVSYVGYQTAELKPGDAATVGVNLKTADNTMGEVVVTAMDIKRSPRSLGYSTQSVSGKDLAETQRENFLNSLQGRVAGLTITPTTGQAGASSSIVLRGFNSLTGNNQPLFVVDGIILDNSTINETSNGGSGLGLASDRPNRNNDYTNRIADLNPNDIESVTVLKGPEATALYGSQASAGAIVISTKKAIPGKVSFSYDNNFRFQSISRYADLNNDYAPGSNGVPGASFSASAFSYFGPRYPAGTPKFNNIDAFFRTGFSQTHNLGADVGFKDVGFKISGSYFNNSGVVPTNEYKKYNVRITNSTKIGKWAEITPSYQYIYSTNDKPMRSAGGYLLGLYSFPVTRDITTFEDADGNKVGVFSSDPGAEIDNPLYNVNRNHSYDKTTHSIYNGGINLFPFKWLTISGRFGYETYQSSGYSFVHPLSSFAVASGATSRSARGSLDNYWRKYKGYNHTITATAKRDFGKFSTRLMVGTMWQDYKTSMFAVYGTGLVDSISVDGKMWKTFSRVGGVPTTRLAAPVQVTDNNFDQVIGPRTDSSITTYATRQRLAQNKFGLYNYQQNRQLAYFGEIGVSWKNIVYLDFTERFESSSLFPKEHRNYNYSSYSASVILSDLFPGLKTKSFNFWKLRGSKASTARAPDPYKNQSVFVDNFTSSAVGPIYSYGFDNNNPNLEPERQKTMEVGTEMRFLNSRLGFDVSYYNTLCTKQIQNQFRASYATGFILNTQNAASSRNEGVEIVMDVNPVRKKDFNWNIRFNFNHTWSKILSLPDAIAYESYIADTWLYGNARGGMIRGMPATTITGYHYLRNTGGQIIISPTTGIPIVDASFTVIGDRMPDFTLGTLNNMRYKNWNLSFLWDLKVGGDVFDATEYYLTLSGKSQRTADRMNARVISGVLQDGKENSANPTINTIAVVPYFQQTYYTGMPEEEFVEKNVNWLRLRDITLNYTLPERMLKSMRFFKSLGVFLTGNDLILWTNYRGADPSTSGNTASANGVGGMGFDYGNLPTPTSYSFGIKAIFK